MEHSIGYAYCLLPTSKPGAANILYTVTLGYHGDRRRQTTIQKSPDPASTGVSKLVPLAMEMVSSTAPSSYPLLGTPRCTPCPLLPCPTCIVFSHLTHSPHTHQVLAGAGLLLHFPLARRHTQPTATKPPNGDRLQKS